MPSNTTGSQDNVFENARTKASEFDGAGDLLRELVDIIEDLDNRLTETNEATEAVREELKEANSRIVELEREIAESAI